MRFANDFILFCIVFSFFFMLDIPTFFAVGITPSLTFLIKPKLKSLHHSLFFCHPVSILLFIWIWVCHPISLLSLCLFPGSRVLASRVAHHSHFNGVPQGRQMLHPSTIITTTSNETSAVSSSFAVRCEQKQNRLAKTTYINKNKKMRWY